MKSAEERFKSGISRFSLLSILYAMIVFVPANMFLSLMGVQSSVSGTWFMLLLFTEFAKLSGVRISKQEAAILFIFAGGLTSGLPETLIQQAWVRQSDIVKFFHLEHELPDWWAPSVKSGAFESRSFFHSSFLVPIIWRLAITCMSIFVGSAIGLWGRELFIEEEKLPFPIQQMSVQTLLTITGDTETEGNNQFATRLLSSTAVVGIIWGVLLYCIPFLLQAWTGSFQSLIPIPWIDFTTRLEYILPGALFGLATDLNHYTMGFVLPFPTILQMFIGSFVIWVVGSWLSVRLNPPYGPFDWWSPGITTQMAWGRAWLYFFTPFYIGLGLCAGLMPLLFRPQIIKRAFSYRGKSQGERVSDLIPGGARLAIVLPLAICIPATLGIFFYFVPDFAVQYPWLLAIYAAIPFLDILLIGRALGETGVTVSFPDVTRVVYYALQAPVPVWFAPTAPTGGYGTPSPGVWLTNFKIAQLTETKASSLLKISLIFLPISLAVSFFFMQAFWSMAPIPSAKYPGPAIFWPATAAVNFIWIAGREAGLFSVNNIIYAFLLGTVIYAIGHFTSLPISLISLIAGASQPPQYATSWLIGGILALALRRVLGRGFWDRYRYIIAGGIALGEAIAITTGVSIALIINSLWAMPY